MRVEKTKLSGCLIITPNIYVDSRGYFLETFQKKKYKEIGIDLDFVQDNRSHSKKNVLRGLHFQKTKPQGKLVSVTHGTVYDVAVDLRKNSNTFGEYVGVYLSAEENNQVYIPPGFAHGFCVISESADFLYKCTDYYDSSDDDGLIWNDLDLAIDWPIENPIISDKDSKLQSFSNFKSSIQR